VVSNKESVNKVESVLQIAKKIIRRLRKKKLWDTEVFPSVIVMELTNYCNLRCSMCAHQYMTRNQGQMDKQLAMKVLDEIAVVNRNARVWMNGYGESLIIRKAVLYEVIAYAKEKGIRDVVLNSNGILLDEEAARCLVHAGLDQIFIGIDSCTPETYQKLRVGGDYQKVVRNVKQALEIVRNSQAEKPIVTVQLIEMEENQHEKEDFIAYWKEQGARVRIQPKVSWLRAVEAKKLMSTDRYPCHWVMHCAAILYDGRVTLCGGDYEPHFVAGNVIDESLQSIWQGKLREIRELHRVGNYESLPPVCRDCKDWQAIGGQFY